MLLPKGFEVELYTGTADGEIVGLSDRITAMLPEFMREPDSRNVEYATQPSVDYGQLLQDLLRPRLQLRDSLRVLGNYTLIPGSTLSLGGGQHFFRSDPKHPYHTYIERTYGTSIVTTSIHINVGISDPEILMRACRLIRLEAPLYLALSASSPFLNGDVTGFHSTRWHLFPKTPPQVPLFESHDHYIRWTNEQLEAGTMQNVRHLWTSVRPNGPKRPYQLNRLELRICDLISDPEVLLAITALLEARLWQLMLNPQLDPLVSSHFPANSRADDLIAITEENEAAAALYSLNAPLRHWRDGRSILAKDWIWELYTDVFEVAQQHGFGQHLGRVPRILEQGNQAQQWLKSSALGISPQEIMTQAIQAMQTQEQALAARIIRPLSVCA